MLATYLKKERESKRFMKKSKAVKNAWQVGIMSEDAIDVPCIYSIMDVVIVSQHILFFGR